MSERILECVTALCREPATRFVSWTYPNPGHGTFCEAHATLLDEMGDTVEPPFGLAPVIPLRADHTEGET